MLQNIVVPLDGSELSRSAVPHAIVLAQKSQAKIHLLHVLTENSELGDKDKAEVYLRRMADDILDAGNPVQIAVHTGDAAEEIGNYAISVGADMIVMATHGVSGLTTTSVGSVAERVMHDSDCPLLLVHGKLQSLVYRCILVLLDGTSVSEAMLPVAAEIALAYRAKLVLLQVIPASDGSKVAGKNGMTNGSRFTSEKMSKSANYLNWLAGLLRVSGLNVEVRSTVGDAKNNIVDYIVKERPDLVFMATHTHRLQAGILFGSVADYIMTRVTVPLILYHYHDKSLEELVEEEQEYIAGVP